MTFIMNELSSGDCSMNQQLLNSLAGKDNRALTESDLQKLAKECLTDDELSELLSGLCKIISEPDKNYYSLYKATIVLKHLCDLYPEKMSTLLIERLNVLKTLISYSDIDDYGKDRGINVAINTEQLLDFIASKDKESIVSTIQTSFDSASEQLFQTSIATSAINSESVLNRVKADVNRFNKFLRGPITPEKYIGSDKTPRIDDIQYGKIIEKIVDIFDKDWPTSGSNIEPSIEQLFVVDGASFPMFHESLTVLDDALKESTNPRVNNSIVTLLEKLIKSESLYSSIIELCKPVQDSPMKIQDTETKWRKTLQILVSLPNRIANKFNGKVADCFLPDNYAKIITLHVGRAITFVHSIRREIGIQPRLQMISMLISKAVIVLGVGRFESLFDIMSDWCLKNSKDIAESLNEILRHLDRPAIHPIAVTFLSQEKPREVVQKIFHDLWNDPNWKHVFTAKIPLLSYHRNDNVAKNLIGYLSTLSDDKRILKDLLTRMLDIWGDRSAMNHTSLEQHEYITKLIVMSVRESKDTMTSKERENAKRLLLSGTSAHLESTQTELRAMGMITGEIVIENLIVTDDEPKLKYEYDRMPEESRELVEKLRNLQIVCDKSAEKSANDDKILTHGNLIFDDVGQRKLYELAINCGTVAATTKKLTNVKSIDAKNRVVEKISKTTIVEKTIEQSKSSNDDDDLDSDDDLVAYDMSNDTPIAEQLRPRFLRDFKENLINARENTDPNIFEQSLLTGEQLIASQLPNDDATFGVELLELLIGLREISCVNDFELLRFKCCVAIVTVFPKESAGYLCKEFHKKIGEYSIKDRLFMLDVLRESARKLSKIEVIKEPDSDEKPAERSRGRRKIGKPVSLKIDMNDRKKHETLFDDDFEVATNEDRRTNDWEDIVSQRIASNTRIFAHQTKLPVTTMNRFNDVASSFFYPLLYGFRRKETSMCDTAGGYEDQENILLVNYLKTLSTIMIASENCIVVPKIAKEILELTWTLRYHSQAKVRLAVIENTASVVMTLPKTGLTTELMEQIFEMREWLSDVSNDGLRGDPDSHCRDFGKNVVALIDSIFHSVINES